MISLRLLRRWKWANGKERKEGGRLNSLEGGEDRKDVNFAKFARSLELLAQKCLLGGTQQAGETASTAVPSSLSSHVEVPSFVRCRHQHHNLFLTSEIPTGLLLLILIFFSKGERRDGNGVGVKRGRIAQPASP